MDGRTDLPTNLPTDTARCRVACPRLKRSNDVSDYRFNNDNNSENDSRDETFERVSWNKRSFDCWQAKKIPHRTRFDDEIRDADGSDGGKEEEEREVVQNGDA